MNMTSEQMAEALIASGDYKIHRRIKMNTVPFDAIQEGRYLALMLDVETTGLDTEKDKIIELGMHPFEFTSAGEITRIFDAVEMFNDPCEPLEDIIVNLTGITDDMVKGQSFDRAVVDAWIERADLVLAHNAGFDRKMAEREFPGFATKVWGCTQKQVPWADEGIGSAKLDYLLHHFSLFHDGHRAAADCYATLFILQQTLPISGASAMEKLIAEVKTKQVRIYAANSPFESKEILKGNGFTWNPDETPEKPKAWFIDVPEGELDSMLEWLGKEVYGRAVPNLPTVALNPRDRFSVREG